MKQSLIIIDMVLILSIFFPYYLFIVAGRKGKRVKLETIKKITSAHGIVPSTEELWRNSYIGIDSARNSLVYIKFDKQRAEEGLIPLNKVMDCNLIKEYKRLCKGKGKEEVLNFLAIELYYNNPKTPSERITFYDSDAMTGEDYEIPRAEKWMGLIRECLNRKKSA